MSNARDYESIFVALQREKREKHGATFFSILIKCIWGWMTRVLRGWEFTCTFVKTITSERWRDRGDRETTAYARPSPRQQKVENTVLSAKVRRCGFWGFAKKREKKNYHYVFSEFVVIQKMLSYSALGKMRSRKEQV